MVGRQNAAPGFDARSGWSITLALPGSAQLKAMTVYNGNYPWNNENDVTSVTVRTGSTTIGTFTPGGTDTTTRFDVSYVPLVDTLTLSFQGSYYACVRGISLELLYP